MKLKHRIPEPEKTKPARMEPMAEGIQRKPSGFYSRMTGDELVAHAEKYMHENGLAGKEELRKADIGLYSALRKKGVFNEVAFEGPNRYWRDMDNEEIIRIARAFILEKKICGRVELQRADVGLYGVLSRRNLLDSVGLDRRNRDWTKVGDEEIIRIAREFIAERKISARMELQKADQGLFGILLRKKLLGSIGLESTQSDNRDWANMNHDEIIKVAKEFIEEKGITGRTELAHEDPGLYQALRKKRLFDAVGLRRKKRDWAAMGDQELVGFSCEFIQKRRIEDRKQLELADYGLYQILIVRKLIDSVGLERDRHPPRKWASMGDEEFVGIAKAFIIEREIRSRGHLKDADTGLFEALRKRGLLDALGLENRRGEMRDWASMESDELVSLARAFIIERGIEGREGLRKADIGLHNALYRRDLLDSAFSDKDQMMQVHAVDGVIDALDSFGDDG